MTRRKLDAYYSPSSVSTWLLQNAEVVKSDINHEGFVRLQAATALKLVFDDNGYICETNAIPALLMEPEQILDAVILDFEDL
jgi:hypothetical protein